MYRYVAITAIVTFVTVLFITGYPLRPESLQADYAVKNPGETARCFEIGNADNFLECMFWDSPRLDKTQLVQTVVERLNQNISTGGYLFIGGLILFLLIACYLIIAMIE